MNINQLKSANTERWSKAKTTRDFSSVAKRLVAAKARYETVASETNVPWWVIAVIHERESSQSWSASLAQGDPWDRVSTHVPKGRGPFTSWEAAAVDALKVCPPYASKWTDWSAGGAMTLLEQYNGLGYFHKGLPSPYVWSGTDQYVKGKYVRDGVFDPNEVDEQLGCAGLVLTMRVLDPSILTEPKPTPEPTPAPVETPAPQKPVTPPVTGWAAVIAAVIAALGRK